MMFIKKLNKTMMILLNNAVIKNKINKQRRILRKKFNDLICRWLCTLEVLLILNKIHKIQNY
jgi:hypothetical protein